jgi:hypothetical protein
MQVERTLFIWKVVSVDSTTMRTGIERTGIEIRTEQTGAGQTGTGQTGTEQTGTERIGSEGTRAIGIGRLVSATRHEGRRAQMGNGTLKSEFR